MNSLGRLASRLRAVAHGNPIAALAGQTFVYGLSSILGRLLNYLLVPLYTRVFMPGEYGVVTELYAYVSFLSVIFTYGMETAFFRYASRHDWPDRVYTTALSALVASSVAFSSLLVVAARPIAALLKYEGHEEYIIWLALILGLDAVAALPFARLRQQGRAARFAAVRLAGIGVNICLNLLFLVVLPGVAHRAPRLLDGPLLQALYRPEIGVGYVFIANLIASLVTLLLLSRELLRIRGGFDGALLRGMLRYGLPILVAGLAGMVNETIDRILLKFLLPLPLAERMRQIGIYGACYKLSIIMTLFIQAFRMAAEPFFFERARARDAPRTYAAVMNGFVLACSAIYLLMMMYMDIVKLFIGPRFHDGLAVVPVLLLANLCLGVYYNLSIWYKLADRTLAGAYIALGGALITILLNLWWIPTMGYMGAALATLGCYASMMVASFLLGQRVYPVPYEVARLAWYVGAALAGHAASALVWGRWPDAPVAARCGLNTIIVIACAAAVLLFERRRRPRLRA